MKYLRNILFGITIPSLLAVSSCNEDMYEYPEYSTVVYLKDGGIRELKLANTTPSAEVTVTVGKGGVEKHVATNFAFSPLTADEISAYNDMYRTNYVQLPAECYILPENIQIPANESQITTSVHIDIDRMISNLDYKKNHYALLLNLTSDANVNDDMDILVINPEIFIPEVLFDENNPQIQSVNVNVGSNPETSEIQFPFYLNYGDNDKDFSVMLQTDESALQALAQAYNKENNTDYQLLESKYYNMPQNAEVGPDFVFGTINIELKNINSIDKEGVYILPVQMKDNTQSVYFKTSSEVCYLLVNIQQSYTDNDLTDITSTFSANNFSGNNWTTGQGYEELVDDEWENGTNGTFYQSAWSANDKAAHGELTKEYGLSININLSKEYKAVKFGYVSTREGTKNISSPHKIRFYGSTNGENWIPLTDEITDLPEVRSKEWYQSPIMKGNIKHLKLAVLETKNKNGGIEDLTSSGTCIISEIRVWAVE